MVLKLLITLIKSLFAGLQALLPCMRLKAWRPLATKGRPRATVGRPRIVEGSLHVFTSVRRQQKALCPKLGYDLIVRRKVLK